MIELADKTSLIINAVNDNGDKVSKAITSINPNASPMALKNFAQKLSGLTNDTFTDATRVEQVNVTGAKKVTPTIFVSAGGCNTAPETYSLTLDYPGPARAVKLTGKAPNWLNISRDGKTLTFEQDEFSSIAKTDGVINAAETTITLPENDYYNAASVKFVWASNVRANMFSNINKEV